MGLDETNRLDHSVLLLVTEDPQGCWLPPTHRGPRGAPTSNLTKCMFRRLKYLTTHSPHNVNNAKDFIHWIRNVRLKSDASTAMVSFDVVRLFTLIAIKSASQTLELYINNDQE